MDVLHGSGYTVAVKYKDGSDDTMAIRWYRCEDGAKPYPYPQAFASTIWEADYGQGFAGVGEIGTSRNGCPKDWLHLPGDHYEGLPQWFLSGVPKPHWNDPAASCQAVPRITVEADGGLRLVSRQRHFGIVGVEAAKVIGGGSATARGLASAAGGVDCMGTAGIRPSESAASSVIASSLAAASPTIPVSGLLLASGASTDVARTTVTGGVFAGGTGGFADRVSADAMIDASSEAGTLLPLPALGDVGGGGTGNPLPGESVGGGAGLIGDADYSISP